MNVSEVLYNIHLCKACQCFIPHEEPPLPDQLPGEHTSDLAAVFSASTEGNIRLQFLASGLSNYEIRRISGEIHPKPYKSKCFNQNYSVWWMQERGYDPGFHEIRGHSSLHAPPKLKSFGWNICFYKVLGGFHLKSARVHEIRRISWMWAFAWWSSIGLSFERPNSTLFLQSTSASRCTTIPKMKFLRQPLQRL